MEEATVKRNINYPASTSGAIGIVSMLIAIIGMVDSNVITVLASLPFGLVAISSAILSYRADT